MTSLFERITKTNSEIELIRKELLKIENYYSVPYNEMFQYYHIMKPKQAEKYIEGWVATHCGGKKLKAKDIPDAYKKNDNGDIWFGNEFKYGINHVELKCVFKQNDHCIGGGQFRFYENVPYYMFFKSWSSVNYEIFLLTKDQLVSEIINRAEETGKNSVTSSQGSGIFSKLTQSEKIDRLRRNVSGEFQDKLGWSFNSKTEPDFYKTFQDKYKVDPTTVIGIINK